MNEEPEVLLDTALATLPLTPLPDGFMTRLRHNLTPRVVPVARFRLDFLDVALPLGVGVFAAAILLVFGWYTGLLALDWLPSPTQPLNLPSLTDLSVTIWAGVGILILAIEAILAILCILAYTLWGDNSTSFISPG